MKAAHILQAVYSFFLGLALVGFFVIGVNTFYPEPPRGNLVWEAYQPIQEAWAINTSIILLVLAVVALASSMIRAEGHLVIANGLLLGGLFTLFSAVIMSLSSEESYYRFAVISVALVITILVGWYKFVRKQKKQPEVQVLGSADLADLSERLTEVESRLRSAGRALG